MGQAYLQDYRQGKCFSGICRYFGLVVFIFVSCGFAVAQITSPSANFSKMADYPTHQGRMDPIFIFCASNTSGNVSGSLEASHPDDPSDFNFEWRKYNPLTSAFDPYFRLDTVVKMSQVSGLESGGYKVNISNGGPNDTSFIAWVFIDKPQDSVAIQNFTCDYLKLNGIASAVDFTYYDPEDHTEVILENGISFEWSSIPPSPIPYPTLELNPVTWQPPFEDTDYYLNVTDSFACRNEDSLSYHSIHVKPEFTTEPTQGEAPLTVSYTNSSLNAVAFEWHFGDDSTAYIETPDSHIYYIPGNYEVTLIAWSEEDCVDSVKYQYIVVDPSELAIPNVFTPNDDPYNQKFVVAKKSLRSIHMQVFSRTGKKVYEFSGHGTELDEWEGWDGKINGKADASPGVYYYIIRAVGWDDIEYEGKLYRGTVYLIREK